MRRSVLQCVDVCCSVLRVSHMCQMTHIQFYRISHIYVFFKDIWNDTHKCLGHKHTCSSYVFTYELSNMYVIYRMSHIYVTHKWLAHQHMCASYMVIYDLSNMILTETYMVIYDLSNVIHVSNGTLKDLSNMFLTDKYMIYRLSHIYRMRHIKIYRMSPMYL